MLKFQTATKEELKLAASIQRRRMIDQERKQRIFNPRFRKIGIDREFLDKQVAEKRQQRDLEKARETELDLTLIRDSNLALLLEKQQEEERRKLTKEVQQYRQQYQRPDQRREYDPKDPNALRKAPLLKDEDAGFGTQKFEGEEKPKESLQAQREQFRWWIEKQKSERVQTLREREEAEKAYQEAVISRDKRTRALDQMERECRRRLNEATARFNRAMAEEQEQRRRCEAIRDEEDKKAEIYNHVNGDFLTEAKEQADSIQGPHKPLASRYKGMNPQQLRRFKEEQLHQIEEIEKMKLEEKRMNEDWNRLMNTHAEIAVAYQREMDRKKALMNKRIAEENQRLAEQHRCHEEYLKRVLYKNEPMPEFFEQFNRDAR